jgi:hypothetical protein
MGIWALSTGVKRPGREVGHSLPTSAEVKKTWIYTSTLPYIFLAWRLAKHRDKFTLLISPVFMKGLADMQRVLLSAVLLKACI